MALEKTVIDHLLAKGVDTLVVDPFTPRNESDGICANLNEKTFVQCASRGGNDALAALKVLKAMPDIDAKRVFLEGYSFGAISSLFATDANTPGLHSPRHPPTTALGSIPAVRRMILQDQVSESDH